MASIREQIVDALVAAAATGAAGAGIPVADRSRTFAVDVSTTKVISAYWRRDAVIPDEQKRQGVRPFIRKRLLEVVFDIWAKGTSGSRPDEEVDPVCVWINAKLDGLENALWITCTEGTAEPDFEQYDHGYCRTTVVFHVVYSTKAGNLEAVA